MSMPCEMQRIMRANRRSALHQRGVLAALDLGTSKVSCAVLQFQPLERNHIVKGHGYPIAKPIFKIIGTATTRSVGVRLGEVSAIPQTGNSVRHALLAAQKLAKTPINHVAICFSGGDLRSFDLMGGVTLRGPPIAETDVAEALANCRFPETAEECEILHAHPVNFVIDNRSGISDPRGQFGRRLAVDLHLLGADRGPIENMVNCINQCGVEIAGMASSAYTSGLSTLVEDEQELGAACIDMGGGITGISVFFKKHMIHAQSIRVGGDHITSDISNAFSISTKNAERMKIKFGAVTGTYRDDREFCPFDADAGFDDGERKGVTRTELIGVIRPRIEEILEEVKAVLDSVDFSILPGGRVVFTGGSSALPGLDDVARKVFGPQVRFGQPMRLSGLPQQMAGPQFSSLIGLCLNSAEPQDEWWDFPEVSGRRRKLAFGRMVDWVKENW